MELGFKGRDQKKRQAPAIKLDLWKLYHRTLIHSKDRTGRLPYSFDKWKLSFEQSVWLLPLEN